MLPTAEFSLAHPNGHYTYADYLTWKYPPYVELIQGWASSRPTPGTQHQQCLGNLAAEIGRFLKSQPSGARICMGPLDVRLTATGSDDFAAATVVLPDLFVVQNSSQLDKRGCLGAPDCIIEIVSPGTATHDTKTKFDLYAENGVGEYWIVFPGEETIAVYVLQDGKYQPQGDFCQPGLVPSRTLPDLQLEWADAFEHVA